MPPSAAYCHAERCPVASAGANTRRHSPTHSTPWRALDVWAKTSNMVVGGGGGSLYLRIPPRCCPALPVPPIPLGPTLTDAHQHDGRLGGRTLEAWAKTLRIVMGRGERSLYPRIPPQCRPGAAYRHAGCRPAASAGVNTHQYLPDIPSVPGHRHAD